MTLQPALDFGDVVIRPCYLAARDEHGHVGHRFKARYFRRCDGGELVAMTDPEIGVFLLEHPEAERLLLEHRAVSAELRADHAERRLKEAQTRVLDLERLAAEHVDRAA